MSRKLRPEVVVSCGFSSERNNATNHFRFDAHRVKFLLVHGSRLCAIVCHKDKTLAYAALGEHFECRNRNLTFLPQHVDCLRDVIKQMVSGP